MFTTYIQINNGDFVPNILGFNARDAAEVGSSLINFPGLFGSDSVHSSYPSALSGETRPNTQVIIHQGGQQ